MRILLSLVLILLLSNFSSAVEKSSDASDAVTHDYGQLVIREMHEMQDLETRVAKRDRTICPGFKSGDMGSCLNQYLKTANIDTVIQLNYAFKIISTSAMVDRKNGLSQRQVELSSLDSIMKLTLRLDPSRFFLANLKPKNEKEKKSAALFLKSENETLAKVFLVYKDKFSKIILELQNDRKRAPASVGNHPFSAWEMSALDRVESDLQQFKKLNFQIPLKRW